MKKPAKLSVSTILMGLVGASLMPAALFAQIPPPKKEAELVAAGNKALAGPEISALLLGNTIYMTFLVQVGRATPGTQTRAYYRDARTRVMAPGAGHADFKKYEANWWIEGNHVCHETQVATQGHPCMSLYKVSPVVYGCGENGVCHLMFRVVPGNPDKL